MSQFLCSADLQVPQVSPDHHDNPQNLLSIRSNTVPVSKIKSLHSETRIDGTISVEASGWIKKRSIDSLQRFWHDQMAEAQAPVGERILFKQNSIFRKIASSQWFESATLFVICLNSVWLAIDADYNKAATISDADLGFQVVEHAFCIFFFCEWLVRLLSYRVIWYGFYDAWFVFDTILVLMMVLETWVMLLVSGLLAGLGGTSSLRLIRLLRLMRMARMVRLLRAMPALLILIMGMAAASVSVMYTFLLLILLMYVFGLTFVHLTAETAVGDQYFSNVLHAMCTLLINGTFMDSIGKVLEALAEEHPVYAALFVIFTLLAAFMVINLLIGVLCEVVSAVSAQERDAIMLDKAKASLIRVVQSMDTDNDGVITQEEFLTMLRNEGGHISKSDFLELCKDMEDIGLDIMNLLDVVDDVFGGAGLSYDQFMESICRFRGTRQATLKDITQFRNHVNAKLDAMDSRFDDLTGAIEAMANRLDDVASVISKAPSADRNTFDSESRPVLLNKESSAFLNTSLDASCSLLPEASVPNQILQ